jgi:hypothetical protein
MTHLLFCDETTIARPSGGRFFLYCGLVVPPDRFAALCDLISAARDQVGLDPSEPLKFSPRACPTRIGREAWTAAKSFLLEGLAPLELPFIGVYVHESIASSDNRTHWAIDAVCVKFNEIVTTARTRGLVIVDHTKDIERGDLADIASGAVKVSIFRSDLGSVGGICSGHVEAVLPLQAVDVATGALRYCLEHPDHDVSVQLRGSLRGLAMAVERRPWTIKIAAYRADYERLQDDWQALSQRTSA